jgi:hypothetical protein
MSTPEFRPADVCSFYGEAYDEAVPKPPGVSAIMRRTSSAVPV